METSTSTMETPGQCVTLISKYVVAFCSVLSTLSSWHFSEEFHANWLYTEFALELILYRICTEDAKNILSLIFQLFPISLIFQYLNAISSRRLAAFSYWRFWSRKYIRIFVSLQSSNKLKIRKNKARKLWLQLDSNPAEPLTS